MSDEELESLEIEETKPTRRGGRQPVERLWDDDAFLARVAQIALKRRLSMREVVAGAGLNTEYLTEKHPYGRNVNIMMRIAKFLDVEPAYLIFGVGNDGQPRQGSAKRQTKIDAPEMSRQLNVIEEMMRIAGSTVKAAEAVAEAMCCVAHSNQRQIEALVDERNAFFHFRPAALQDEEA